MSNTKDALKLEEMRKKRAEEFNAVKLAVNEASRDVNVKVILRYLAKVSGFFFSPDAGSPAIRMTDVNQTFKNIGRESLYLDIRRMMTDEVKTIVERKGDDNA